MPEKSNVSLNQISFFAALCMFLSAVEYAIPKPLPFLRLGLANLPILVALKFFSSKEIFLLIGLKILGQALISGTLFSYVFLFSLSGSVASGLMMWIFYNLFFRPKIISNIGLSLSGAFANSFAQLICARFIMFGENSKFVAPVLLISSFVTGLLLGIFANVFESKSLWFCNFCGKTEGFDLNPNGFAEVLHRKRTFGNGNFETVEKLWKSSGARLLISSVFMLIMLICDKLAVRIFITALFFMIVCVMKKGRVRWWTSVWTLACIVLLNLLNPFGKVLFAVGPLKITSGAILVGLRRGFLLVGMIYISKFAINKNFLLPGKIGLVIGTVFFVFDRLTEEKIDFKEKNLIKIIDEKLIQASQKTYMGSL